MTSANPPGDSEQQRHLLDRLTAAVLQAKAATERYVQIGRECARTVDEARELRAAAHEVRDELRSVVTAYVAVLRTNGDPPERVVRLVKDAVDESSLMLPLDEHQALREEVVRWAVDAYYAA